MMQAHDRVSIDEKSFACEICWRRYSRESDLKSHLWIHTQESKTFSCDICHRAFPCLNSRNNHFRRTHKEENVSSPQSCAGGHSAHTVQPLPIVPTRDSRVVVESNSQVANSSTGSSNSNNRGKHSAPCLVCGKTFAFRSYIKIHQTVHTKEKPYGCDLCHKKFSQPSSRNRHRKEMHREKNALGELPPKVGPPCSVCGKIFPCKSLLEIHNRVHTKERPYSCDLCFKTFTQVSSRNFHLRKVHKEVSIVTPLNQNQSQLQLGISSEQTHQNVNENQQRKNSPPCGVCGKTFAFKNYLEVHSKEKPYNCDLCGKTFSQASSRNFHRRRIHKEAPSPNASHSHTSHGNSHIPGQFSTQEQLRQELREELRQEQLRQELREELRQEIRQELRQEQDSRQQNHRLESLRLESIRQENLLRHENLRHDLTSSDNLRHENISPESLRHETLRHESLRQPLRHDSNLTLENLRNQEHLRQQEQLRSIGTPQPQSNNNSHVSQASTPQPLALCLQPQPPHTHPGSVHSDNKGFNCKGCTNNFGGYM